MFFLLKIFFMDDMIFMEIASSKNVLLMKMESTSSVFGWWHQLSGQIISIGGYGLFANELSLIERRTNDDASLTS